MMILRTFASWLFSAIFWVFLLILFSITLGYFPEGPKFKLVQFWGRGVLRILGVNLRFHNPCNFWTREGRVVICNHQSSLDVPLGAALCPPLPLVVGKKEVAFIPILNLAWLVLRFIRVDRKNREKALASLQGVIHEITRRKRSFVIAPEGTRTKDGSILPFKKGAFHTAITAQVPIYPFVMSGPFELMPKGQIFPRKGSIWLHFLEPVPTQGKTLDDMEALIEEVRTKMVVAYEMLRQQSRQFT